MQTVIKRLLFTAMVGVLTLGPSLTAEAQRFGNCAALRKKYAYGVAINFAVRGTSEAEINRRVYLENQKLDRDADGIVCEYEGLQNAAPPAAGTTSPSTTTSTTAVATYADLTAGFSNPRTVAEEFGKYLASVKCGGSNGTAVSVSFSSSSGDNTSYLATTDSNVRGCITASYWQSGANPVDFLYLGQQYSANVTSWERYADVQSGAVTGIAGVKPRSLVMPQLGYWGVPTPRVGHSVIVIPTLNGVIGTPTTGTIISVDANNIITSAGFIGGDNAGGKGALVLNARKQFLGIVWWGDSTRTQVYPITKFCESIFSCTSPIVFKD